MAQRIRSGAGPARTEAAPRSSRRLVGGTPRGHRPAVQGGMVPSAGQPLRSLYRFEPASVAVSRRVRSTPHPTVARFAVSSAVMPRVTAALSVVDRLRSALIHHSDGHPIFVGRDTSGQPGRSWSRPCMVLALRR